MLPLLPPLTEDTLDNPFMKGKYTTPPRSSPQHTKLNHQHEPQVMLIMLISQPSLSKHMTHVDTLAEKQHRRTHSGFYFADRNLRLRVNNHVMQLILSPALAPITPGTLLSSCVSKVFVYGRWKVSQQCQQHKLQRYSWYSQCIRKLVLAVRERCTF